MGMAVMLNPARNALVWVAVLGLIATGGCSKQEQAASAPSYDGYSLLPEARLVGGENKNGSQLAYEHDVHIRVGAKQIADGVTRVREACSSQRLGQCNVLQEKLEAGESPSGSLQLRVEPKAVGPMVQLAAKGGDIVQRSTTAEDLADAVRDNGLRGARLKLQHAKLSELVARSDLKAEDLIKLTDRLSEIESQVQATEQEAAQQQRRINTNLLTLHFNSTDITAESSEVTQSIRGFGRLLDRSTATLISIIGASLPGLLLLALVWWIVRRVRRNRR
jgi:hypothetical protein